MRKKERLVYFLAVYSERIFRLHVIYVKKYNFHSLNELLVRYLCSLTSLVIFCLRRLHPKYISILKTDFIEKIILEKFGLYKEMKKKERLAYFSEQFTMEGNTPIIFYTYKKNIIFTHLNIFWIEASIISLSSVSIDSIENEFRKFLF